MTALSTLFALLMAGVALSIAVEVASTLRRLRRPLAWAPSAVRVQKRLAAIAAEDRRTQSLPYVGVDRRRAETIEDVRRQA
jgi:hypothetical protein